MLDTFTVETFTPRVGELFRVIVDEKWELRTRLSEATPWGDEFNVPRPRQPFTLLFHGPADSALPQGIYRVENESMEPFEIFLAPVGPDEHGMRYEAIFT